VMHIHFAACCTKTAPWLPAIAELRLEGFEPTRSNKKRRAGEGPALPQFCQLPRRPSWPCCILRFAALTRGFLSFCCVVAGSSKPASHTYHLLRALSVRWRTQCQELCSWRRASLSSLPFSLSCSCAGLAGTSLFGAGAAAAGRSAITRGCTGCAGCAGSTRCC